MAIKSRARRRTWLLAAALPFAGIAILAVGSFNGRALEFPIALVPGTTWAPSFRVTRGVRYVVLLELDRTIPFRELECLLGQGALRPPCIIEPVVSVGWKLRHGAQEVASGTSHQGMSAVGQDRVAMLIGQFEATAWSKYVLELDPLLDGSALAATNPRVVVQFHPEVSKGFRVFAPLIAFLTGIAAIPLALLGLGALAGWREP
ncbi:MAG: hypothetical protein M3Y79_04760 [Pseudomonadota bacterium]|nr:hypothetical protein [Pseudomonadota bacterium]